MRATGPEMLLFVTTTTFERKQRAINQRNHKLCWSIENFDISTWICTPPQFHPWPTTQCQWTDGWLSGQMNERMNDHFSMAEHWMFRWLPHQSRGWMTDRSFNRLSVHPSILPSVHPFACPDESGHLSKQCKMKFILLSILRFDSFTELGRPQCNFEAFSSYSPARSFVRPALHSRIPSQTFAYQTQTIGWKWRYSWFCGD